MYVNDAFGTAHRAHGSTAGVTEFLKPSVAGFLRKFRQYVITQFVTGIMLLNVRFCIKNFCVLVARLLLTPAIHMLSEILSQSLSFAIHEEPDIS